MGILRTLIGAALCIGLGIFLGSHSFSGHTAVEHAERALDGKLKAPKLEQVKEGVEEAIDQAKKKLATKEEEGPTEKHSREDRDAVNRIIGRRKP
jgi:hypothetical protein